MVEETAVPLVKYITINTDDASARGASAEVSLQIGLETTKGRGAGANSETGRQSVLEHKDANFIFDIDFDETMGDTMKAVLVAVFNSQS